MEIAFNLAPFFYRDLYDEKNIISKIQCNTITSLQGRKEIEALVFLAKDLVPEWAHQSSFYSNADGSGTSEFTNVAIHKAMSEALERWAFYETIETYPTSFSYDENPSSTGIAAFPSFFTYQARKNAWFEAVERWAVHEFWRGNLPVVEHFSGNEQLRYFEVKTNLSGVVVTIVMHNNGNKCFYAFAAAQNLRESLNHSLIELFRNIRSFKMSDKLRNLDQSLKDINDQRIIFFSSEEGSSLFLEKIEGAPKKISSIPILICDQEIKGPWTKYTKVWRCLFQGSIHNDFNDSKFFMF